MRRGVRRTIFLEALLEPLIAATAAAASAAAAPPADRAPREGGIATGLLSVLRFGGGPLGGPRAAPDAKSGPDLKSGPDDGSKGSPGEGAASAQGRAGPPPETEAPEGEEARALHALSSPPRDRTGPPERLSWESSFSPPGLVATSCN